MTFALKSYAVAEMDTALAVNRSPIKIAIALFGKSFWLLVWLLPDAAHRGSFETLLLAGLSASAALSLGRFVRLLWLRQPLLIMGCNGIQDPRHYRFPTPWIRAEGCAFHSSLFERTLRIHRANGHIDIDLTLASKADAELAFRACAEAIAKVRATLSTDPLTGGVIRDFPKGEPLPILPAAAAMATGISAGFVIGNYLGLLKGWA